MFTPTKLTEYTLETNVSTKTQKVWKKYSNSLKMRKNSSNSLKKRRCNSRSGKYNFGWQY